MRFIGIDPGLKGAIAHYDTMTRKLMVLDNEFDKQKFATPEFYKQFMSLPPADVAILENVQLNGGYIKGRGWSAKGNATMQRGVGTLGSFANQIAESVVLVSPVTWKGQLYLTDDKQLSMDIAHLRFPKHKNIINRHDIAEACLLISWYLHGDSELEIEAA